MFLLTLSNLQIPSKRIDQNWYVKATVQIIYIFNHQIQLRKQKETGMPLSGSYQKQTVSIYFMIKKTVRYGEAVYVIGSVDDLGKWKMENALRLTWNKDDYWTGFLIILKSNFPPLLEFKFAVGSWSQPEHNPVVWQNLKENRKIYYEDSLARVICDYTWNESPKTSGNIPEYHNVLNSINRKQLSQILNKIYNI